MVKAKVNGIECVVYGYYQTSAGTICRVKYKDFDVVLPVLAALVELSTDA